MKNFSLVKNICIKLDYSVLFKTRAEQTCSQANQKTKNIFTVITKNTLNKQTKFYGEEKN